jgi:hypothetical protein
MAYEYQDWYNKIPKYETREQVKCPVCKSVLGYRSHGESFMEHCDDCKATYTWKLDDTTPTVSLDCYKKKSKRCGCGRCD